MNQVSQVSQVSQVGDSRAPSKRHVASLWAPHSGLSSPHPHPLWSSWRSVGHSWALWMEPVVGPHRSPSSFPMQNRAPGTFWNLLEFGMSGLDLRVDILSFSYCLVCPVVIWPERGGRGTLHSPPW